MRKQLDFKSGCTVDLHGTALWPCLALGNLAAFLLITITVHLLRPDLDVVRNQMSLYLIGPWGHLLQAAYCLPSLGMLAMVYGLHGSLQPRARSLVPPLLFAWPPSRCA